MTAEARSVDVPAETTPGGQYVGTDGIARPLWAYRSPEEFDYYELEWGRQIITESGVLERICLESFQSGLSWSTVLKKRRAFREVFFLFDATRIVAMDKSARDAALADERLIRNRLKQESVVHNAHATIALRDDPQLQKLPVDSPAREILGGVSDRVAPGLPVLVWSFVPESHVRPTCVDEIQKTSPESVAMAKELKRRGFSFVGSTTCYALMQAIGMVNDRVVEG
ncbi:DNA-3-methyladenine glycosylase I [Corynebacterium anserum]|uniref:DNA-3-methyladenine glycosylase I n=1 Tax=Corynebacterium anserum TaxID=2684406 RepID=A0A7G7YLI9_9CORY|nr:DNA-3-methyladenine glycosylase I [Corynebacterium anserum]MBC2682589.1 DNA-3-methyladenine glycosylase I [Corynebacterium anserum]QNH95359.1 DNA-3-methyladenine glycosylase I [Corynebacterium anserum]